MNSLAAFQPAAFGEDGEPGKREAFADRTRMRPLVESQAERRHAQLDGPQPSPQFALVVPEQEQIVHVAHVAATADLALDEMVDGVQVHVGPELARQIANRQTARPHGGQQIVTRKERRLVRLVLHAFSAGENAADELEAVRVLHFFRNLGLQELVIHARKELAHVHLQDVRVASGERLCPGDGAMGTL